MIIFQTGDVFAGRFRLEQRIGQGGMGQVWRATQLGLGREVALKLIHPHVDDDTRFRQMFFFEAQVSARLAHPNIVPVVDFGEHEGGILWMVQIFVRGRDLAHVLERAPGGLPFPLAGHISGQILLGLQCAHDHGVIHRDLKPGNVLISHAGDVQITDFGIAKVVAQNQTPSISTVLKGSPGYLAPELLRGLPARPSSDLFSVGGLFVELLTGRNPFIKGPYPDRDQIFFSTLNDPVPLLAESGVATPPGLDDLIQKLVSKDPGLRYESAADALDDLLGIIGPFAREASPLQLKKFLAATQDTCVAPPSGAASDPPHAATYGPSGVSGQVANLTPSLPGMAPPRRGRRGWFLALAGGVVVLGAAAVGVKFAVGPASPPPPASGAQEMPPALQENPGRGRLIVTITPADAHLALDSQMIPGTSPFVLETRPVGSKVTLRAERQGYLTDERQATIEHNSAVAFTLRAVPEHPDAGPPPTAAPAPSIPAEASPPSNTPETAKPRLTPRPAKRRPKTTKEDVLPI